MTDLSQFRPPHVVEADERLADRLRAGDGDALVELTERYTGPIAAVAAHLVAARGADGDDLGSEAAVDTLVAAWNDAESIDAGADFAPWMLAHLIAAAGAGDTADHDQAATVWIVRTTIDGLPERDRTALRRVCDPAASGGGAVDASDAEPAVERLVQRLRHHAVDDGDTADRHEGGGVDDRSAGGGVVGRLRDELGPGLASVVTAATTWTEPVDDLNRRVTTLLSAGDDPAVGSTSASALASTSESITPPSDQVLGRRRSVGRQIRAGVIGAGAAILLLAAGIVAFSAADDPPPPIAIDAELIPTGLVPDAAGTILVTQFDSGVRIEIDVAALAAPVGGRHHQVWLLLDDGSQITAGTFLAGGDLTLWAGVELERVEELTITLEPPAAEGDLGQGASGQEVFKLDVAGVLAG